jgi:hypothetical protein
VTLWRLTDPLEERLETLWEGWLDDAMNWRPFFDRVAAIKAADLSACLTDLDLVTTDEVGATVRAEGGRMKALIRSFDRSSDA